MSSNKRLVPTCIIYIDGTRINTACEGAFRSVHVTDTLNKVSTCRICFDRTELTEADIKNFTLGSRVSIHLGYKDDLNEVFDGEITVKYVRYEPNNQAVFEVTVLSCLHRLNHAPHCRSFERKTPSQAIKEILSIYNLRADCDDFGREFPFWSCEETDLEHILALAGKYGRDIHAIGEKVYVKQLMTHKKDDIIYEWGKSLISFEAKANIKEQAKEITILGWDKLKGEGFRNSGKIGEVTQRVGGKKDWSKVSRAEDKEWVETRFDSTVRDMAEAKELALAKLRNKSFKFITAEGNGEGNSKLFPGMYVTVKYVGGFSGDYIADSVMHEFDVYSGYTTEFYLKRNMVDEEFKKSGPKHVDMRAGNNSFHAGNDVSGSNFSDTMHGDEDEFANAPIIYAENELVVYADREEGTEAEESAVVSAEEENQSLIWVTTSTRITNILDHIHPFGIDVGPITRGVGGDPIRAPVGGTIRTIGPPNWSQTHYIILTGDDGREHRFAYAAIFGNLRVGSRVEAGQQIATMSNIGTNSVHLHYDVVIVGADGRTVRRYDPLSLFPEIEFTFDLQPPR